MLILHGCTLSAVASSSIRRTQILNSVRGIIRRASTQQLALAELTLILNSGFLQATASHLLVLLRHLAFLIIVSPLALPSDQF